MTIQPVIVQTNVIDLAKLQESVASIQQAALWLQQSGKSPKIAIKIARNLGDSLHGTPIIKHYRTLHPNAGIVFMCEQRYHGAHEYNKDIDKIFVLPNDLNVPTRLALWEPIKSNKSFDIAIIPTINPFQYLHPENKWLNPHPNIVTQFMRNAGIQGEPLGGRQVVINVDDNDRRWADDFLKRNNISEKLVAIEYNSYSSTMAWNAAKYAEFIGLVKARGWQCVSLAGTNEPHLPGTIDGRGASWRQTVALFSKIKYLLGCSSGNTMLALASRPQPKLIELNPPEDCRADTTGYVVPGNFVIGIAKPVPAQIAAMIT